MANFRSKNISCNDITLPGYIKCDFGADFRLKLQILIFGYSLKNSMNYYIKPFEGPILALQGFFTSFGHLYKMFQKTKSGIFPIFVKKCTIEFGLNLY